MKKTAACLLLVVLGCHRKTGPEVSFTQVVQMVKAPNIAGDGDGGFVVSYIDAQEVRYSRVRNARWSRSRTVAKSSSLLVNGADFPAIAVDGQTVHVSWSTRNGHGSAVHLATTTDDGKTWKTRTPHPELVSQFGFVSLLPGGDVVFLDGRKLEGGMEGSGEMELRTSDALLDPRVCDCCQTAAAITSEGPIFAYRDRSAEEVRDIAYVRRSAAGWSEPKILHADGWKIAGCPVNGPQLDARGKRVVAAWFTAANDQPRAYAAFSDDAGATFSAPIRIDAGKTSGRVDVALLDDTAAVVTFVENGVLYARRVSRDGRTGAPLRIGEAGGFPRVAVSKENVGVVWSETDGVHFATLENL